MTPGEKQDLQNVKSQKEPFGNMSIKVGICLNESDKK